MHACHQDNDIFTDSIKRRIVLYSFLLSWSDADIHGRYAVTMDRMYRRQTMVLLSVMPQQTCVILRFLERSNALLSSN